MKTSIASTFDVYSDLAGLYARKSFSPCQAYSTTVSVALTDNLSYTTPCMYGVAATLFSSNKMVAYNLIQNAIDEAKGAARICIIADRYATGELHSKMKRHMREEMKHSHQFLELLPITGISHHEEQQEANKELGRVLDFDDDLQKFLCRVHSIEIRSWTMLRIYIDIINDSGKPSLSPAIPVLEQIMEDEINHVVYTGVQLSQWLESDEAFATTLQECLAHTNRETWHDIACITNYLANNCPDALN